MMLEILNLKNITIIDYAKVPEGPVSPSIVKNAIIGAAGGFVLSCGYIFLAVLLDKRLKNKSEAEQFLEIPVLAEIPSILRISMKEFVDIHNHSAWNVDDGVQSFEEAKACLTRAKEDGIEIIVSTPHYIPGRFSKEDFDEITKRQYELIELGKKMGIQIYLGSEIFLNDDYLEMFDQGLFHPLAEGKYVLVEFDVRKISRTMMMSRIFFMKLSCVALHQ